MSVCKDGKMKKRLIIACFCILVSPIAFMQGNAGNDNAAQYQDYVEKSVLSWADLTFEFYDAARFEKLEVTTSNEYMKLQNKIEGMKEYKIEMNDNFNSGSLNKSKEDFDKMMKKTDRKIDSMQTLLSKTPAGVSGFEIDFWANIMTNNGLTVYYKHHLILNADYKVINHTVTSSVGKTNEEQKILYKNKK